MKRISSLCVNPVTQDFMLSAVTDGTITNEVLHQIVSKTSTGRGIKISAAFVVSNGPWEPCSFFSIQTGY